MIGRSSLIRACILVTAGVGWFGCGAGTHAQSVPRVPPLHPLARFVGLVTSVLPANNPRSITLQLRARSVDFRISPAAVLVPNSAEAEVEGLQVGDYAVVQARHMNRGWTAFHIEYDVQPIVQGKVTVSGTITRITVNDRRFVLKLATGETRLVLVTANTAFRIDGVIIDTPPELSLGDMVQVTMRTTSRGWVAMDVNLKTSNSFF